MKRLHLPDEVANQQSRKEVLRVWLDQEKIAVSLISQFPKRLKGAEVVWPIVLSDIFHHVADALRESTKLDSSFIRNQIQLHFQETLRSDRRTYAGGIHIVKRARKELSLPELSETSNCFELIRVFFVDNSIKVLVLVGVWLPNGEEESVWGNILYDLTCIIAQSLNPDTPEYLIKELSGRTIKLMEDPDTRISGHFYRDH